LETRENSTAFMTPKQECRLTLSDGSRWRIVGTGSDAIVVAELARILRLEQRGPYGQPTSAPLDRGSDAGDEFILELQKDNYCPDCPPRHSFLSDGVRDTTTLGKYAKQLSNYLYALLPIYKNSIQRGGLPLHAAAAERDGKGVLLAAPSGVGKSTCCLCLPSHWQPLCDDETLVIFDRTESYRAHPFPTWSDYLWKNNGKTWETQYSVPLVGLFFLEQSTTDTVEPLGQGAAAALLNQSTNEAFHKFWGMLNKTEQKRLRITLFDNSCTLAKLLPACRLRVSPHGKFWEKMEHVLERKMVLNHVV
jgi:SynChlorMet cassette protein ScmC